MNSSEVEEVKRHLHVVAESLRSEIRLVAEGVESVRVDLTAFKAEVKEEFEETRAMIRLLL